MIPLPLAREARHSSGGVGAERDEIIQSVAPVPPLATGRMPLTSTSEINRSAESGSDGDGAGGAGDGDAGALGERGQSKPSTVADEKSAVGSGRTVETGAAAELLRDIVQNLRCWCRSSK